MPDSWQRRLEIILTDLSILSGSVPDGALNILASSIPMYSGRRLILMIL